MSEADDAVFCGGPLVVEKSGVPQPLNWRERHDPDCPTLRGDAYCICGCERPA